MPHAWNHYSQKLNLLLKSNSPGLPASFSQLHLEQHSDGPRLYPYGFGAERPGGIVGIITHRLLTMDQGQMAAVCV